MPDFILLMHNDVTAGEIESDWGPYLNGLSHKGVLRGGSAIGDGICVRRGGPAAPLSARLTGFVRVAAASLDEARALLHGNPVYEAGGTVEIRELPVTD